MTLLQQWWLVSLGRTIIWAQLRELPAGTAQVLDSDGNWLAYDSLDSARSALLDAEFVAYDGLDEDDAIARGFTLDEITPPSAEDEASLLAQMVQTLPKRN